ncbi:MAG: hypothetical protein ACI32N_01270 [Bulleidia sp.]
MAKTEQTKLLEEALHERQVKNGEYGCEEVTIGFKGQGKGDEIVDYMTMDSKDQFRCYEIKVTLADLKTDNALSFYGDYNYLVVSQSLYLRNPVWDNHIPPYVGILCGTELKVVRQSKKRNVDDSCREMLKSSLLRSVCLKFENHRNAQILSKERLLEKQMDEMEEAYRKHMDEADHMLWVYRDYEHYYAANHQCPAFSLEQDAKRQRNEYEKRRRGEMCWEGKDDVLICPVCGVRQTQMSDYCPVCGSDLRSMHE